MATWRENRAVTERIFEVADGDLTLVTRAYNRAAHNKPDDRKPTESEVSEAIRELQEPF